MVKFEFLFSCRPVRLQGVRAGLEVRSVQGRLLHDGFGPCERLLELRLQPVGRARAVGAVRQGDGRMHLQTQRTGKILRRVQGF